MSLYFLERFQWWHLLIIVGVWVLYPVFRAVAVVLVAKCVNRKIAILAIPLILKPLRPWIWGSPKSSDPSIDSSQGKT